MKKSLNPPSRFIRLSEKYCVIFCLLAFHTAFCQNKSDNSKNNNITGQDSTILNQYIQSKGKNIISFDASNIKQFWTDKSVAGKDGVILLNLGQHGAKPFESVPLKLQLVNVNEAQDCKVEVLAESKEFGFSILNNNLKTIATSKEEDSFLDYAVATASFHLEDTANLEFNLKFDSKNTDVISIKNINLSFDKNKSSSFLSSPGTLKVSILNISSVNTINEIANDPKSFTITGNRSRLVSQNKLFVTDHSFSSSITIKNIGNVATRIYVGYITYTKHQTKLDGKNFPYSDQKTLKVVSTSINDETIVVDSFPTWKKNCFLALNVKDDSSDIPNIYFAEGTIVDVRKTDEGYAEIVMSKKNTIKEGTSVRVNGISGSNVYTDTQILLPGEEKTFSATIKRDNTLFQYSKGAFPNGTYYVTPLVLSYSVDSDKDNTIQISDFSVSY